MKKGISVVVTGLIVTVVGGLCLNYFTENDTSDSGATNTEGSVNLKCIEKYGEGWTWNEQKQQCEKIIDLESRTFSVPLSEKITSLEGRMDFYLNKERLVDIDAEGRAMYENNVGVLQVVISIMKGKKMVGSFRERILDANDGSICTIRSLPKTTGWLKKMQVSYSLQLKNDCNKLRDPCSSSITDHGKRVYLKIQKLTLVIVKDGCTNY
ncbi:hypothetical protein [Cellulophaga baltica]|uniref:hypothetical protein n=1 Tax=Cellulophaga baltica TaxID=76594 RepID=UPI0024959D56|nr:hypothetical protein [Cellulophaga baltica]